MNNTISKSAKINTRLNSRITELEELLIKKDYKHSNNVALKINALLKQAETRNLVLETTLINKSELVLSKLTEINFQQKSIKTNGQVASLISFLDEKNGFYSTKEVQGQVERLKRLISIAKKEQLLIDTNVMKKAMQTIELLHDNN